MTEETQKKYVRWEWWTIIATMLGYAGYYFVRKNLSAALPAMEEQLGLTKAQLGIFLTLNGVIYGVSRFINGMLADRVSGRKMMSIGLFLSALVNLLICFSPKMNGFLGLFDAGGKATIVFVYVVGSLWMINGYLQGMGVPPCHTIMANWIKPSELPFKMSIWNASHSLGAGVVVWLCGWILHHYGYSAWNLCFLVPALIAILTGSLVLFGVKDKPTELGFPPVEKMDMEKNTQAPKEEPVKDIELKGGELNRFISEMVFKNPYIWILALTNFCLYVIRFTILDWGVSIMTQFKEMDISMASTVVGASEVIGGITGMLLAGWLTNKLFQGRAHRTCFACMLLSTVCFVIFWISPSAAVSIVAVIMCAFFLYGPQALLGISALMQATKHAAASANGILGIFGYVSPLLSGVGFGLVADNFGWSGVLLIATVFGIIGTIIIALMWNAPADGYARGDAVLDKIGVRRFS